MPVLAMAAPYRPRDTFGVLHEQRLIHAELRQWREAHGFTQLRLGRAIGVSSVTVSRVETLRTYPSEDIRQRLAGLTGIDADRLFPAWLKEWIDGEPMVETTYREVSFADLGPRDRWETTGTLDDTDPALDWRMDRPAIDRALDTLGPRERRVLVMRFGLDGQPGRRLDEVAHEFGLSRERIRQLEASALRKLRRSSVSGPLRDFTERESSWLATERNPPPSPRQINIVPWLAWLAKHPKQQGDRPSRLANIVFEYACCSGDDWPGPSLREHVQKHHMPRSNREFWEAWDEMIAALPPSVRLRVA